jgi:DNA-directed RNA polymerase specialized sigma24 family protein
VLVSAESQAPGSKEALADLCELYWYPLYGHIRRYGFSPHDAQDLTQGFFLDLLEHKALSGVDQQRQIPLIFAGISAEFPFQRGS